MPLTLAAALFASCDSKPKIEESSYSLREEEAVEVVDSRSEGEVLLEEWGAKLSDPEIDRAERREVLEEFGMDSRIPIYDLVLHVTENFPEEDWFSVFFHRVNKEGKTNILECLRAYPLLDKGKFAKAHCDRSFGLAAGEQAPLEGIAWCEGIQDPQRRKSAAYGLKVSFSRYANKGSYQEVTLLLKRILEGSLFENYEKDSLAFSLLTQLHRRGLLEEDSIDEFEDLLSEDVLRRLKKLTEKSGP
ncbi:MAG: hypothetical protein AAGI48_17275 [Verrucomicrobiota bacterium]